MWCGGKACLSSRYSRLKWAFTGDNELVAVFLNLKAAQTRYAIARRNGYSNIVDVAELDAAVAREAEQNSVAQLLQTHPGIGPIPSLAFVLTLGEIERFPRSRQVVSYLGLNPSEHSSGARQRRYGAISKQGNPMLRSLLVEAGQSASRVDMELKRAYQRLKQKKHSAVAKVMVVRKLAVRLYWMWKTQQPYSATRMQGSLSHPVAVRQRPSA